MSDETNTTLEVTPATPTIGLARVIETVTLEGADEAMFLELRQLRSRLQNIKTQLDARNQVKYEQAISVRAYRIGNAIDSVSHVIGELIV